MNRHCSQSISAAIAAPKPLGFHLKEPQRARRSRGSAIVEFALLSPLLFFIMLVSFDLGLYAYAFISVQNGVRVAALRNSSGIESASDQAGACALVLKELRGLPNTGSASGCDGSPVSVSSTLLCPAGCAAGSAVSADGKPAALVTVKYSMPAMFQLHLAGADSITRSAQMRIRSAQ